MRVVLIVILSLVPMVASADWPIRAGAIAWSPSTGRVGYSWGQPGQDVARDAAITACGAGDCRWQVSEANDCAAFATGPNGRSGWAYGPDREDTQRSALDVCGRDRWSRCHIAAWVCN